MGTEWSTKETRDQRPLLWKATRFSASLRPYRWQSYTNHCASWKCRRLFQQKTFPLRRFARDRFGKLPIFGCFYRLSGQSPWCKSICKFGFLCQSYKKQQRHWKLPTNNRRRNHSTITVGRSRLSASTVGHESFPRFFLAAQKGQLQF